MICKICENSQYNKDYKIKEMMFGYRDEFTYFECSKCGCLQIAEIPKNMEKYYPSNYGPHQQPKSFTNFIGDLLSREREYYAIFKKGLIGKIIHRKYQNPLFNYVGKVGVNYNSRILDVGCGNGHFLYSLNKIGFKNLMGVDKYIPSELLSSNNNKEVKFLKMTIHDLPDTQKFDLIIFSGSLTHMPDHIEVLKKTHKPLSPKGAVLIDICVKTDYIWDKYGVNWVQIDAPRHFIIHSLKSFEIACEKAGFIIRDKTFCSTEFQFWGSELYMKDIPLMSKHSYWNRSLLNRIFPPKQIKEFKKMAEYTNKNSQGDEAIFYLTKNIK